MIRLRSHRPADAPAMRDLVAACPPLDGNGTYAYLLICRDFAETSVIACDGPAVIGMLTAYRPPQRTDTLFVWQVAVSPAYRGLGLARRMLDTVLERPSAHPPQWLETTVGPDNRASQALFAGLARHRGLQVTRSLLASGEDLGPGHAAEILHRVGPLSWAQAREAV